MSYHKAKIGYLYVVATQSGTVKFGISKNPKSRIKSHHYAMGRVSPIVFEWVSEATPGFITIEKKLIFKYGGEYVDWADPEVITQEIAEMISSWVEEESASKPMQRTNKAKLPVLSYRHMLHDLTKEFSNYGFLLQTSSYMPPGENILSHQAILFMFGFIDDKSEEIVLEAEYLHGRLSKCSPAEIVFFSRLIAKRADFSRMNDAAVMVGVDLNKIEGLLAL